MLKITLTISFFFSLLSIGLAQLGSISGKIIAEEKPQEGVAIFVPSLGKGTVSDRYGTYTINNLPAGEYTLHVTYVGYRTISEKITLKENEQYLQDFDMQPDAINLGQFVVTGTRNAVPTYQSPVIVSTISRRMFESTQSLSLSEGLSFSPGLRLENNCQNCGFTQVRINGLEGPYTQILINSRPVFSALAGVYGLDMLPTNMVDRIEVVRGGGSVLYGGNAIAGTINILTKDPVQNSFEVGINQAFTDFDASDRTLTFNGSVVGEYLDKGISFYGYNRSRNPWDANGDDFSEMTQLNNTTFGADAFWNTSARSKLKLGLYNVNEFRRGGNAFELAPHQTDITEQLNHRILGTNLSFEQYSKDYKHKFALYSSAQFVNRDSYYGGGGRVLTPEDTITPEDILAINAYGKSNDVSLVNGLQYAYEMNKKVLLTLGSEYQYNDVLDEMPGYGREIDQQVGTLGNYGQIEWKPNEKITLLGGGRYDLVNIKGRYDLQEEAFEEQKTLNVFVPRLSMMYAFQEGIKARVSFAQGYRAPQAFEEDLHIETVGGAAKFVRLSPDLITERSNNLTASLNYTKIVNKTQLGLVLEGFFTQLNNPFILSDQVELPSGVAVITKRNGEGASVQGANLEFNFAFSRKWIIQSGITLQSALYSTEETIWSPEEEDDPLLPTTTNRILRTPNAYGYLNATYTPNEKVSISYSGVYTGSMDVPHVIDVDNEYTVIKTTPTFFEHNLKLSYRVETEENYHVELFGGLQNIFNAFQDDFDIGAERDANYIYGPSRPRTVFFGLKFGLH